MLIIMFILGFGVSVLIGALVDYYIRKNSEE